MEKTINSPQESSRHPNPLELRKYADWFLRFIDPDMHDTYQGRSWDLLRALLRQHRAEWIDGMPSAPVSTLELWERTLEEHTGTNITVTSEQARRRVNEHWAKLTEQFNELEGRFTQAAEKEGYSGLLWPSKNQSDGGNSSTYLLAWRSFGSVLALPGLPLVYEQLPYTLRYYEDQSSLRFSFIGRMILAPLMFKQHDPSTVRIDGIKRWVPAIGLGILTMAIGGVAILALILRTWSLLILALISYWAYLRPLVRLYNSKIMMANPMFYPFKEKDCLIEVLWDQGDSQDAPPHGYNLRLVRYTANCPLCNSKVWLEDGGLQFFNRIIGRCVDEPNEHVFSFDRKLKSGYWLRNPRC